jgi:hypothetical protein
MEDSRMSGHHGIVTHPTMPLERTYCVNCGRPWGWCSQGTGIAGIQVICDDCETKMNEKASLPPDCSGVQVPRSYLEMYGLIDENDPRVKDLSESTRKQEQLVKQFLAEKRIGCPNCGGSDYHLEDNPDNPAGPQVAICHRCSADGGMKKGWLLRERIELILSFN